MTELLYEIGIVGVSSFILTAVLSRFIIPILRQKKIGQSIREEGPFWHRSKEGTPTMGGICFIMAMLLSLAGITVWYASENRQSELIPMALTMALAVMNGLVGFVDDYCKLIKHQNEGLKPLPKFILQTVAAVAYVILLVKLGYINTVLHIPFTEIYIELSAVYYIFAVILIVGIVNSVNFTDGVDGLASGVTLVVAVFFAAISLRFLDSSLSLVSGGLIGAMCAQRSMPDEIAATVSVYLHGLAGDSLAREFSSYGVTPSDLPRRIAAEISEFELHPERVSQK